MKKTLLSFFLSCSILSQAQTTWFVNGTATVSGDGTSWDQAFRFLDEAFSFAADGDKIWVAKGRYIPGGEAPSRTSWLEPQGDFELYGGFIGTESMLEQRDPQLNQVIISGDVLGNDISGDLVSNVSDNLNHLMLLGTFITNATKIDGITFTRGITDGETGTGNDRRGGGILSVGSPVIRNCTFIENAGWIGGSIYTRGQYALDLKIFDSHFEGNGGGSGGGLYAINGEGLEIENCTFTGNTAIIKGAALRIQDAGNFKIKDCIFSENIAQGSGGAINFLRANGSITDSKFNSNTGNYGGAIVSYTQGKIDIDHCEFTDNHSYTNGAVLSLAFETTTNITNCTFVNNHADVSSGAVYIQGSERPGRETTQVSISDCMFSDNNANSHAGAIWSRYSSIVDINRTVFITNQALESAGAIMVGPDSLGLGRTSVSNAFFLLNSSGIQGGAIDVLNGDVKLTNCVLSGNNAASYGGGLMISSTDSSAAAALVVNCTYKDNLSILGGNELSAFSEYPDSTNVEIQNSIFKNDNGLYATQAGEPRVVSLGGNVISTGEPGNIFSHISDVSIVDADQIFKSDLNLSLKVTSPAINAGIKNENTPIMDVTGLVRDNLPDAGAYEAPMSSEVNDIEVGVKSVALWPNPARSSSTVTFEIEDLQLLGSTATILVFDYIGSVISKFQVGISTKTNQVEIDTSKFRNGSYTIQLKTNNGVSVKTLVKM